MVKMTRIKGITADQWDRMLGSFREVPGGVSRAAAAGGVSRPTASKAWNHGMHYLEGRSKPIKEIVETEQRAARAAALDAKAEAARKHQAREADRAWEEAEKARQDVIKARRQEADMVRAERSNVIALIGVTGQVLRGAIKSAKDLERMIESGYDVVGVDADGKEIRRRLSVKERVEVLWKVGRIVRQAANAGMEVVRMERLLLGEPTEIVGMVDLDAISEEEAIRDIEAAYEAAQRVKERRLTLIDGGRGKANGKGSNGAAS